MDGLVLVDKPPGKTSHDLTLATRRLLGVRKAGHAGTLDPFATGLLLVLVGRARRVQRFLMALPKEYVTVARLGAISTTGDPEGEITHTGRIPPLDVALPTGRIVQRPPIYSAVRVQGRKAYERARDGEEFEVPEREVDVYRFEQQWRREDRAQFLIECSAGTYVRSLIAELGDGYCEELRRTRIGPFDVAGRRSRSACCRSSRRSPSCRASRSTPTPRGAPATGRRSTARPSPTSSTSCWPTPTGRWPSRSPARTAC